MPEFKIGEGLSGQAVEQKKILLLENVDQEHLSIRTGMAEMAPLQILIIPLHYNEVVMGLIEIAPEANLAPGSGNSWKKPPPV
jgi:putative methionine-R-sulfoxide reductase with GAF domain